MGPGPGSPAAIGRGDPRACGAIITIVAANTFWIGRSPRVRGCPGRELPDDLTSRPIPAYSGPSVTGPCSPTFQSADPRASGAVKGQCHGDNIVGGRSPGVRGGHGDTRGREAPHRTIPARPGRSVVAGDFRGVWEDDPRRFGVACASQHGIRRRLIPACGGAADSPRAVSTSDMSDPRFRRDGSGRPFHPASVRCLTFDQLSWSMY